MSEPKEPLSESESEGEGAEGRRRTGVLSYGQGRRGSKVGNLVRAILFACVVGFMGVVAGDAMLQDGRPDLLVILMGLPLVLSVCAAMGQMRVALAIGLISLATFVLMLGLCSQVTLHFH